MHGNTSRNSWGVNSNRNIVTVHSVTSNTLRDALAKETKNSEELIGQLEEIIQQIKCGEPEEAQQEE